MQKATILLVEDEPSMLNGMRDLLQIVDIGYDVDVLTAANGQAGLEILQQQQPDLIVSDIMMPIMSGYDFLHEVRRNPAWIHIPFIFLTAKGEEKDVHKGRTSGANLYITKPFDSNELLELIKVQLDRNFQLQATRQQNMVNLKRDLMQILNHEFRTPLTYITAYLDMIVVDNDYGVDENFPEYLRGIQAGCVRLTRLVEDFIKVLELRTGEAERQLQANAAVLDNLLALLTNVVETGHKQAQSQGVTIHYKKPVALPPVWGTATTLHNALLRILDNAIKFTHTYKRGSGQVFVETAVTPHEVHLIFRDEGMGFPAHETEQLFDLFFQYNRGQFEQQGAGLGLTIAQGIINLHGGRIEATSEEGAGSTFTVVLPIYQEEELADRQSPRRRATVLIVEDDFYLLTGLQELLEIFDGKYELHVLTASDGHMGLEVLQNHQPNLIISDIMMPEMSGYEFLQEVRQNPKWVQIPFIFLTAKGERSDIHQGWRSGVDEYITKPYDSDQLLELVVSQLDRHFQVQSALAQNFESLKRSILDLITPDIKGSLHTVTQYSEELTQPLRQVEATADPTAAGDIQARLTQVKDDQELKDSLKEIQADSIVLTRLVEDLITLAELRTGEAITAYHMRAQAIPDCHLLLAEMAQHYQPDESISLTVEKVAHDLPPIHGVSTLLTDSLSRIIDACIQRQAVPEVSLSAQATGSTVEFVIACDLPLTEAELAQIAAIFDGQAIAGSTLLASTRLQIAYGNVALHNGRITIQPLNPEAIPNGTDQPYQITITIPIADH
jgi:DNA-binding response OmpR family regulator/two-component sensor histidine kinase